MTIRKVLDISISHLPMEQGATLNELDGVVAHEYQYGWLMWVPNDPDESNLAMEEQAPENILMLQRYARDLDCDYIMFDRDAEPEDQLPSYEW